MKPFLDCRMILLSCIVLTGCGDANKKDEAVPSDSAAVAGVASIISLPATLSTPADTAAVLSAVRSAQLGGNQFVSGKSQDIRAREETAVARIDAHTGSNSPGLAHGKVLARLRIQGNSQVLREWYGWEHNSYTYWIAAQFDGGQWQALMVNPTTGAVRTRPMYPEPAPEGHDRAKGEFKYPVPGAVAVAGVYSSTHWVTCDGGTCCCSGPECENRVDGDSVPAAPRP